MELNEDFTMIFSLIGSPARITARVLLSSRYVFASRGRYSFWKYNEYAKARFGPRYRWMLWLSFDISNLERLESLINEGSDDDLIKLQDSQKEALMLISIVGALLAGCAIAALDLPQLEEAHYFSRGLITVSMVISIIAIFFIMVQHRELGFIYKPMELRRWLSNGKKYRNANGEWVFQSSINVHQLLNVPYEMIAISITLFVAGLGTYLGSAWARNLPMSTSNGIAIGNAGVLAFFLAGTTFSCALFGFLIGSKDMEILDPSAVLLDEFAKCPGAQKQSAVS
ncbi:hypothetical protein K469DRAFT_675265 [Zopfia rhizophila CBS 207.26]|uniref:Uncharacterized protein n=1 Tax=Zopfia rhizophila CBS 207.26 TaxID=1314779 RepID=A0A6A6DKI5_9PEZI|nr:hypothetical protein K469DRAFT_675265 [Zopfia rhizophila CBS 207.26]